MFCEAWPDLRFLIYTDHIPQLIYYSHIPAALIALLVGIFVFLKTRTKISKVLLAISVTFALWVTFNLILWISPDSRLIIFLWSLFGILYGLIFIFCFYFFDYFTSKKEPTFQKKLFLAFLFAPTILFTPTAANLKHFLISDCTAVETGFFTNYYYIFGLVIFLLILFLSIKRYRSEQSEFKSQILLMTIGIELFLFSFITASSLATYVNEINPEYDYEIEQYGLFGMTFFMAMLGYIIVRFKAFNIKLIGAQALVVALWLLIGSLLFVVKSPASRVISALTLILALIGGYFLIKSVKKEVKQREEIELLAKQLQVANERLKVLDKMKSEFVSIASHQLRGPLTSIRGYASMLAEGSYGKVPQKAQEVLDKISDSAKFMALSVEDYLNVSRIEAGNMKYEMSDFNLRDLADRIVDEMRPVAMKKGLVMVFRSDCNGNCMAHADIGKTRQIIMNLIDNSMKYTPKGTITTVVHDDLKKKKLFVKIQDTGVGMSKETLEEVFDKFVRAKNANQINVTGTGLGLYVAKKMTEEMGGRIWAESEGEGKGSTFIVEFPTIPGKVKS